MLDELLEARARPTAGRTGRSGRSPLTWYGPGEVGGVDEDRSADVDDRGRRRDPLVVDRDRLRAGQPELVDDRPRGRRRRRGSRASLPPGGTGCVESSSLRTMPVPVSGIRPAAIRASSSSVVERPDGGLRARRCPARSPGSVRGGRRSGPSARSCWSWRDSAVSTSGVRSWLVYRTRGPSAASWAAIRKPSRRSATPSVSCQLGIARMRPASGAHRGGSSGSTGPASSAPSGAAGGSSSQPGPKWMPASRPAGSAGSAGGASPSGGSPASSSRPGAAGHVHRPVVVHDPRSPEEPIPRRVRVGPAAGAARRTPSERDHEDRPGR